MTTSFDKLLRRGAVCLMALAGLVAPALAQDAVKIGVLTDLSGPYAEITGKTAVQAAQMAIADFGGSVLGKPIELISGDHQQKPDVGLAIAREWLDRQGVTAILDANNSAIGLAVNELMRTRKRTFLARAASDELIGRACSPQTTTQWVASSGGLARGVALPAVRASYKDWFFLTVNYAFGHAVEQEGIATVKQAGGTIVGSTRYPGGTSDFSSYLLDAQGKGAKTLAIAAAGADVANIIKQVQEFGLKVEIVPFYLAETDIDSIGQDAMAGIPGVVTYFWNRNDESRAFAARFKERTNRLPGFTAQQQYSAVFHYLKAVQASGTTDAAAVTAKMRELPVADASGFRATVRDDGRVMNDMFAVVVKPKAESAGEWDYFKEVGVVKADVLYPAAAEALCPLLAKAPAR